MTTSIVILEKSTKEIYTDEANWWFEFRNTVFGACIIPVSHSITGDRIHFNEDLGMDDVVFSVSDAISRFENWYNDRNETSLSFCVDEEFEDVFINQGIDHLKKEIEEKLEYAYVTASSNTNTDIIIEKDGTVRTHCYFGSVDYRDSDIVVTYTISPQDKSSFISMLNENLSDEQKDFVKENDFLSIWQTSNEDPETWQEFAISDFDWDDTFEEIKRKIDEYESENYDESQEWL